MKMFEYILHLPSIILIYLSWIIGSIAKPFLVVSILVSLRNPVESFRKLQLLITTLQYMIFCKDKRWKIPQEDSDIERYFTESEPSKIERKTIIFVRHGESTWNDTFNRGDRSKIRFIVLFIPNLIKAAAVEWFFWVISQKSDESWFFDSPLSEKGLSQALGLQAFLRTNTEYSTPKEADMIRRLRGESDPLLRPTTTGSPHEEASSQLVSSNLRRAVSTMVVGFQDRLAKNFSGDNITVLSCLQEISVNPDALSITPPRTRIRPAWTDPRYLRFYFNKGERIDTSRNAGNKSVTSNGYERIRDFCGIVFDDISKETVIACGHSLWFKSFFQVFLPRDHDHIAKRKKLVNGGVVGFVLERTQVGSGDHRRWVYRVDPKHIVVLYGGF